MGAQSCMVGACLLALVGCGRDVRVEDDDGGTGGAASTTTTASLTCGVSDEDLTTCEGYCAAWSRCVPEKECLNYCEPGVAIPECRAEQVAAAKCAVKSCASDCKGSYCRDEILALQACEEAHPQ